MQIAMKQASGYRRKVKLETSNAGYLMIAPSFLIYFIFIVIPSGWSVVMSFTDYNFREANFVWLDNYAKLFRDEVFLISLWNTLRYSFMTILPLIVLGLALAVLLNRKIKGRGVYRTLFYLPNIFSMVAVSMAWIYMYDTNAGLLNMFLKGLGLSAVEWVSSTSMAMWSVAIMSIWAGTGYNMVLFLSGLQGIPPYLYESADIDGAKLHHKFLYITLPMLAPTTFFVFVMACIHSFQVFGQVLIVTGGGPMNATTTIAHQIYRNGFEYYEMGYASAQAVVLMLIIFIITMINMKRGRGMDNDLG